MEFYCIFFLFEHSLIGNLNLPQEMKQDAEFWK